MRTIVLAIAGVIASVLWLGLLVATDFNLVIVSLGLLATVYATGSTAMAEGAAFRTHQPH